MKVLRMNKQFMAFLKTDIKSLVEVPQCFQKNLLIILNRANGLNFF